MTSSVCERLWAATKETGRPWPTLTDDAVLDFLVIEAVRVKVGEMRADAEKKAKAAQHRSSHKDFRAQAANLKAT